MELSIGEIMLKGSGLYLVWVFGMITFFGGLSWAINKVKKDD